MAQPVLYIIPSFDAAVGANINFAYEGEQVFANELVIYDNETGSQVYSKKTEWMRTYHVINGGVLQNGKYYYCEIRVFNKEGTASDWSSQKSFRCFTTPQFGFSNLLASKDSQYMDLFKRDKARLDAQENSMNMLLRANFALLGHALNGNNVEQMQSAFNDIQEYLFNR